MTHTIKTGTCYCYDAFLKGRAEEELNENDRKWVEMNRKEDRRCRWIEFEVETAELTTGSEKQKVWAEDIRQKTLTNYAESLYNSWRKNSIFSSDLFSDKEKTDELFATASENWGAATASLSDMVEYRVKHDKLSAALINETDARKIIDVYAGNCFISKGNAKQL